MPYDLTMGGLYAVIPAGVLYDERLKPSAKLLYGEISRLAQSSGYCYASNKQLTRVCALSENTVSELIRQLKDCGHIRVEMIHRYGDHGDVIQRRIFLGTELAQNGPVIDGETLAGGIPKNRGTSPEKSGDRPPKNREAIIGIKNTSLKYTPIAPKEVLKIIDDFVGDDREYRAALEGLLRNRIAMKKPVQTERAINAIINRLRRVRHRETEIAMLDKATEMNWLTVYPLKPDEVPPGGGAGAGTGAGRVVEQEGVTYF